MMRVSYLTVPVVILALFVLGCGQVAPNASSAGEVVPKIDSPTISSEGEVGPQLIPVVAGNPIGNCCPKGFDLVEVGTLHPEDRNGDANVCRKILNGNTLNIDNNASGECVTRCPPGTIPPDCLPDPDA